MSYIQELLYRANFSSLRGTNAATYNISYTQIMSNWKYLKFIKSKFQGQKHCPKRGIKQTHSTLNVPPKNK